MAGPGGLTGKQQKFVEIYLSNGRNGADAYRRAYHTKAAPPRVAEEANRLLNNPKIAPIIADAEAKAQRAIERASDRYAVSRERNVAELARMAYSNIADYTRLIDSERVVDLSNANRDELAAVQEIIVEDFKEGRGADARDVRRVRFKLADKQSAIERLNKMFGWVIDRAEVGNPGDFRNLTDAMLDEKIVEKLTEAGVPEEQAWAAISPTRKASEK